MRQWSYMSRGAVSLAWRGRIFIGRSTISKCRGVRRCCSLARLAAESRRSSIYCVEQSRQRLDRYGLRVRTSGAMSGLRRDRFQGRALRHHFPDVQSFALWFGARQYRFATEFFAGAAPSRTLEAGGVEAEARRLALRLGLGEALLSSGGGSAGAAQYWSATACCCSAGINRATRSHRCRRADFGA